MQTVTTETCLVVIIGVRVAVYIMGVEVAEILVSDCGGGD